MYWGINRVDGVLRVITEGHTESRDAERKCRTHARLNKGASIYVMVVRAATEAEARFWTLD